MKRLDRDLQRRILETLADAYPEPAEVGSLGLDPKDLDWTVNISYLAEHRLVEAEDGRFMEDTTARITAAKITAAGMDFLQADGGLTAILGVVTVRLEAETLKALIGEHVDANPAIPAEEKGRIKTALQSAGSEVLKELTKRLVGAAIDHWPQAVGLLEKLHDLR